MYLKKAYFCSLFWVSVMILLPGNRGGAAQHGGEHVVESGCSQGDREEHTVLPQDRALSRGPTPRVGFSHSPGADRSCLKGEGSFCSRRGIGVEWGLLPTVPRTRGQRRGNARIQLSPFPPFVDSGTPAHGMVPPHPKG